jgi:hypothetical protein
MEIIIKKNSNVYLYKEALEDFIKKNYPNTYNFKDIDYIVGIMFLTELNRYCKLYKLQIHGYYIAYIIILLFYHLRNKLMFNDTINNLIIYDIFTNISLNINYINNRINDNITYKKLINFNSINMFLEFIPKFKNIITYINTSHYSPKNFCKDKCYICWLDNGLRDFFYILFMIAKFLGTGIYTEINILKIAEYYGELFYILLNINHVSNFDKMRIYDKYMTLKTKINEYFIQYSMHSNTIDEITDIFEKLIINKISK